jgi:hypothetical protein
MTDYVPPRPLDQTLPDQAPPRALEVATYTSLEYRRHVFEP